MRAAGRSPRVPTAASTMRAPVYKDHKEAARLAECLGQLTSQTLLDLDFLRRCEEPERRGRKQLDRYVLRGHEFLVYPGNPKGNKSLPREDRMPRMDWDRFSDRLDACALWKRFYRMSKDSFFELLALVRPELERDTEKGDNASFDGVVTPEQRLSITLRYLAGGAYQDICLIHGIVTSTFYDVVKTTLIALDACPALEISFPLYDEQSGLGSSGLGSSGLGFFICKVTQFPPNRPIMVLGASKFWTKMAQRESCRLGTFSLCQLGIFSFVPVVPIGIFSKNGVRSTGTKKQKKSNFQVGTFPCGMGLKQIR